MSQRVLSNEELSRLLIVQTKFTLFLNDRINHLEHVVLKTTKDPDLNSLAAEIRDLLSALTQP